MHLWQLSAPTLWWTSCRHVRREAIRASWPRRSQHSERAQIAANGCDCGHCCSPNIDDSTAGQADFGTATGPAEATNSGMPTIDRNHRLPLPLRAASGKRAGDDRSGSGFCPLQQFAVGQLLWVVLNRVAFVCSPRMRFSVGWHTLPADRWVLFDRSIGTHRDVPQVRQTSEPVPLAPKFSRSAPPTNGVRLIWQQCHRATQCRRSCYLRH